MSDVEEYYNRDPQYEWERLERNKTEFAVTMRAFKEYFPPPPAEILDIGGGPGRYSIAVAQQGYTVTLVDISKNCVEFARKKAKEAGIELGCIHGNALALKFPNEQFDVVLLMGPLYHLLTEKDREKALNEAVRVLRENGFIFASFVTRYAPIRWVAKYEPEWIVQNRQQCEEIIAKGTARLHEESFVNYTWFAHPAEVNSFMEKAELEFVDLIACEGIVSFIDEQVNQATGELWEAWVDLNYELGKDVTVHGTAEHLLYVGRK